MDQVRKEIYFENCPQYTFELDLKTRNSKGELIVKPEKTPEELAEIELRDQVIERIFREYLKLTPEESESSSNSFDIREDYILQ